MTTWSRRYNWHHFMEENKDSGTLSKLFLVMGLGSGMAWIQTQEQERFPPLFQGSLNWEIMLKQNFALCLPVSKCWSSERNEEVYLQSALQFLMEARACLEWQLRFPRAWSVAVGRGARAAELLWSFPLYGHLIFSFKWTHLISKHRKWAQGVSSWFLEKPHICIEPVYVIWPQIIELLFFLTVTIKYENILSNIGQTVKELTFWW